MKAASDDSHTVPVLEMLRVIASTLKQLQEPTLIEERNICWESICRIVRDFPSVVAIMYEEDKGSPFHLQLLHLFLSQAPPLLHIFDTIVQAYPQALDIPYPIHPTCTPRALILKYVGCWNEWNQIGDNQEYNFDMNKIAIAKYLINNFPGSFSLLDDTFRSQYNGLDGNNPIPEGGGVCTYIFGNTIGREYLLDTIEEVYGRKRLYDCLQHSRLTMMNRKELFPVDAIEYLSALYQPDCIKLILSTDRKDNDCNQVLIRYKEEEAMVTTDDNDENVNSYKTLEITFTAHADRKDTFHLNSVLKILSRSAFTLPPLIDIRPEYGEGEFYNYSTSLYADVEEAQELTGSEYFVVDPVISCALVNLKYFSSIVDINCPRQLIDFATGLEKMPNLEAKGGSSLILKFSSVTKERSCNDSDLWEKAFLILSGVQSLDCVELAFDSANNIPFNEDILQHYLKRAIHLEALHVYGYHFPLDPFANALKHNTTLTELLFYGGDGYKYDMDVIIDVLEHYNFTLQTVETGDDENDARCAYYCAMNLAGRKRLLEVAATKEDIIEVICNNTPRKYYPNVKVTESLFGLLLVRPDLWSC
mmetsp:Transcript_10830/g.15958  ORF Transcript_10830/g.15958 Transcript_10830/m.15958 type:complete len:589 (+) Transcript_10830:108-1874(+)